VTALPSITQQQILQLYVAISTATDIPYGTKSVFVKLNDSLGVKIYEDESACRFAHSKQLEMIEFAPRAGPMFAFQYRNIFCQGKEALIIAIAAKRLHAYPTEVATFEGVSESDRNAIWALIDTKMKEGVEFDRGEANIGKIGGRTVCVDFDEGSWT